MRKAGKEMEAGVRIAPEPSRAVDSGLLHALFLSLADDFPGIPAQKIRERFAIRRPSRLDWENAWLEAEVFCAQAGGSAALLPHGLLRWLDGGSFLPPIALLGELRPLLSDLYQDGDPRNSLSQVFASLWSRLHPFAPISIVHSKSSAYWTEMWMRIDAPEGTSSVDLGWLLLPLIKGFPRAFGLPAYEMVQGVADPRPPKNLVDPGTVLSVGGGLELGGMRLAEPVDLAAFLDEMGLPGTEIPGRARLCVVHADYYCPRRRRVVLNAGCAYGAPWFLFKVGFRRQKSQRWNFLSKIIHELQEESKNVPKTQLKTRSDSREPAARRFVYHRADDSISCDGRHLTRSVPARILRRLVRDFVKLGRREFDFRLFKRDPEIIADRKRSNFEVRLRRVEEVLGGIPCGLRLLHPRRGLVTLEITASIEFAEED